MFSTADLHQLVVPDLPLPDPLLPLGSLQRDDLQGDQERQQAQSLPLQVQLLFFYTLKTPTYTLSFDVNYYFLITKSNFEIGLEVTFYCTLHTPEDGFVSSIAGWMDGWMPR